MKNKLFLLALPLLLAGIFAFTNYSGKQNRACSMSQCSQSCMSSMAPDTMRKDPICGMMADDTKKDTVHYKNKVYAFCSKHCKEEFVKNPEAHLPAKKNN